jgi:hypothetical protein
VLRKMGTGITATVIANLIGAAIFFWVDRFIFTSQAVELWHYTESGNCQRCGRKTGLWRLVKAANYDRSGAKPVFLCLKCSQEKLKELKSQGIAAEFNPEDKNR